ncbi:hypothetical protein LG634_32905 [Streptomyces bambusae]|uniref:hypothetical protein n=1 Tax=Streptomyces bambusae TaxID=1550616 RepID=UPI001D000E57|nr:hypothetical protein [Streptomyces bambusae]MCB5169594.1 hypothetical protein [Streptomyces bambusae]
MNCPWLPGPARTDGPGRTFVITLARGPVLLVHPHACVGGRVRDVPTGGDLGRVVSERIVNVKEQLSWV